MDLIKQLMDEVELKKLEDRAKGGDPIAAAEIEARKLGLGESSCSMSKEENEEVDPDAEAKRIAAHWKKAGKGMSDAELRKHIGHDLEQLEYAPNQVARMVPKIIKMVKGK